MSALDEGTKDFVDATVRKDESLPASFEEGGGGSRCRGHDERTLATRDKGDR